MSTTSELKSDIDTVDDYDGTIVTSPKSIDLSTICTTVSLAQSKREAAAAPILTRDDGSGIPTREKYQMSFGAVEPFHFRHVKYASPDLPDPGDLQQLKRSMCTTTANIARITRGGDESYKKIKILERRVAAVESNCQDLIDELTTQVLRLTKLIENTTTQPKIEIKLPNETTLNPKIDDDTLD